MMSPQMSSMINSISTQFGSNWVKFELKKAAKSLETNHYNYFIVMDKFPLMIMIRKKKKLNENEKGK